MCVRLSLYLYLFLDLCTYAHIYIYVHIFAYMYICLLRNISTYMYLDICRQTHLCDASVDVCMCVCVSCFQGLTKTRAPSGPRSADRAPDRLGPGKRAAPGAAFLLARVWQAYGSRCNSGCHFVLRLQGRLRGPSRIPGVGALSLGSNRRIPARCQCMFWVRRVEWQTTLLLQKPGWCGIINCYTFLHPAGCSARAGSLDFRRNVPTLKKTWTCKCQMFIGERGKRPCSVVSVEHLFI